MSFVEYINGLLANDGEAIALGEINASEDPGKLYDLIQGLDPTLAGAARVAKAICARLRELASKAAASQAKLIEQADIAAADEMAISAWNHSQEAAARADAAENQAQLLVAKAESSISAANILRKAAGLDPLKLVLSSLSQSARSKTLRVK